MAFTSGTYWEVQTTGNDANGGGFDTGVAGFPTDGAITSATGASPVISSASYNFQSADVGAWLFIKSGTNSRPGWYQIASVAANAATLNAAIGSAVLFNSTGTNGTPSTALGCGSSATLTSITWGIDFSQQASAEISYTDMVIGGTTTTFTSAGNPVDKRIIGNIINVTSGTGFTVQRVAVVSTSGTTATCDKSLGTTASTGGNGALGGCFLSLGQAGSVQISSNTLFVKTGAYSITSASTNVSGGCYTQTGLSNVRLEGYSTVRGDLGTAPVLAASGISTFVVILTGAEHVTRNITVDCATLTSGRAFALNRGTGFMLTAKNCTNGGFINATNNPNLVKCAATGCSSVAAIQGYIDAFDCVAYANTVQGFTPGSNSGHYFCVAYGNTGAAVDGFGTGTSTMFVNCIAYGNGRDGFRVTNNSTALINCIAESNSGTGFNITGSASLLTNLAYFSNGTNITVSNLLTLVFNSILYTSTAFVNAAGGNFALNATAGGGASLRAAGIPGVSADGLSTGYLDIGAYQHADPVSASGMLYIPDMAGT